MRYWLGRLAMSFVIVGIACAWTAYHGGQQQTITGTQRGGYAAAAVVCLALGAAGMKDRHRR